MLYSELQCSDAIHKAVERMGFAEMTEIQEKTIPVMMAGYDVIAKAPTGTGKTCAFGIPVAEHILPENKYPQAVIMAPTRELAQQIAQELEELTYFMPEVQVACVYGGANMEKQAKRLAEGCQIVVATPGRLMDHYKHHSIDISHVTQIVLDEADEMLNMGFIEDIEEIPLEREADKAVSLVHDVEYLSGKPLREIDDRAGLESLSGVYQGLPFGEAQTLEQQELNVGAGAALDAVYTRREDLAVVHHKQVAGVQVVSDVVEVPVAYLTGGAVDYHQPGAVPRLDRSLRDEFLGKFIVKIRF